MLMEKFYTGRQTKPKLIKFTHNDLEKIAYKVCIEPDEYKICVESASNMWANKKKGSYGKGLVNTEDDPYRTERTGKLGEMAFSKLFQFPVDLTYREGGDDQDFICNGMKLNIKTSTKKPWYMAGLVTAGHYRGSNFVPLEIKHDYYVFGYIEMEDKKANTASIVFVGGCDKKTLINREVKRAIKGSHMNYQIPYSELVDIDKVSFNQ
jgi:hypothetical protein